MRILANENFPFDAVKALRAEGHDVAWIREDARGSNDEKIGMDIFLSSKIIGFV